MDPASLSLSVGAAPLKAVRSLHQLRRRLRVLVHRAYFIGQATEHYFVKITNTSPKREVEITHVWFETDHGKEHILDPGLPKRLRLDETWETWIELSRVGNHREGWVRVLLSSGRVVKSRVNEHVPDAGMISRS